MLQMLLGMLPVNITGEISMTNMGWWTISGEDFLAALNRAHAGEDPDIIYTELYVNSEITKPGENNE